MGYKISYRLRDSHLLARVANHEFTQPGVQSLSWKSFSPTNLLPLLLPADRAESCPDYAGGDLWKNEAEMKVRTSECEIENANFSTLHKFAWEVGIEGGVDVELFCYWQGGEQAKRGGYGLEDHILYLI